MKILFGLLLLCLTCSCSTTKIASIVEALGHDTNSVQVIVTTPWGMATLRRNLPAQP